MSSLAEAPKQMNESGYPECTVTRVCYLRPSPGLANGSEFSLDLPLPERLKCYQINCESLNLDPACNYSWDFVAEVATMRNDLEVLEKLVLTSKNIEQFPQLFPDTIESACYYGRTDWVKSFIRRKGPKVLNRKQWLKCLHISICKHLFDLFMVLIQLREPDKPLIIECLMDIQTNGTADMLHWFIDYLYQQEELIEKKH